jgi:hypothetical protein
MREPAAFRPSPPPGSCRVELFGPARLIGGVRDVVLPLAGPTRLDDLIAALAKSCPALADGVLDLADGSAGDGYLINRNGRDFLLRSDALVMAGDHLLLLSSAVGG